MELSVLLIQQICQLFIMIFFGYLIVKTKVLTTENSKVLSILLLYVTCPCAIINSFMIEFTADKLIGLGISFFRCNFSTYCFYSTCEYNRKNVWIYSY